ncbi:hypothetical protein C8F01DRAFT_1374194 [Mycena amicta]|nr:hypothetical protein C8F01DRAFT_1374194 [Mycena amicta]
MRSFLLSLLFVASALGSRAAGASELDGRDSAQCTSEFSCEPVSYPQHTARTWQGKSRNLSNAERVRRGLPLKAPASRVIHAARTQSSPVPPVTYSGVLQVFSGDVSLGYIAPDPNYWTPLLTADANSALQVSFQLNQGSTAGSQLDFTQLNDNRGGLFGFVLGRDSTSSDIAPGSFNYLYLDPVATSSGPGSTPQSTPSYFSTSSGLDKQAETSVWSVDLTSGDVSAQWINSDSSAPTTILFVQSNHLYAGGDPDAFHSRFPAPVTAVTLKFISN